jgi:hypothetical protein
MCDIIQIQKNHLHKIEIPFLIKELSILYSIQYSIASRVSARLLAISY